MKIGAFYQCYKNPYATYKCLESFRTYYPVETIVLISDNGYDYTEMAEYFKCTYIHYNDKASFIHSNFENDSHIINFNNLFQRIIKAFKLITEEYVIWLEDDVSINNKIQNHFQYDLNGHCPNPIHNWILKNLKETYQELDIKKTYYFTGHGGSIYNRTSLLKCFQNSEILNDVVKNWQKYNSNDTETPSNICQDFLFSILFVLNGNSIGSYNGHYDFPHYLHPQITVQHQFKQYYRVEMPEEIKHLVKIT